MRIGINALNGIKYNCGENWYDFTYHKWMDIIESIMYIVKIGINQGKLIRNMGVINQV